MRLLGDLYEYFQLIQGHGRFIEYIDQIDKGVIMMTDLPKAAQDKIASRGALRSKLKDLGGIVAETEEIMLP